MVKDYEWDQPHVPVTLHIAREQVFTDQCKSQTASNVRVKSVEEEVE